MLTRNWCGYPIIATRTKHLTLTLDTREQPPRIPCNHHYGFTQPPSLLTMGFNTATIIKIPYAPLESFMIREDEKKYLSSSEKKMATAQNPSRHNNHLIIS